MNNLEIVEEFLQKMWAYGNQEQELNINKEAKDLLSKLTFSFQIVSKADKIIDIEQIGSNVAKIKIKSCK